MLKNYIIIALRNLRRNKLYATVNIVGLSLAIACAIVAYLNYDYARQFNMFHQDARSIYRIVGVRTINGQPLRYGMVPLPLADRIRNEAGVVEQTVAIERGGARIRYQDQIFNEGILYADKAFFDFFTFPLKEGTVNLQDKNTIVLTEAYARKYFGEGPAVGKILTLLHANGVVQSLTVTGVVAKYPPNSSIQFNMVVSSELLLDAGINKADNWAYWTHALFIKVSNREKITALEHQLRTYLPLQNAANQRVALSGFTIDPLDRIAALSHDTRGEYLRGAYPPSQIIGIATIAILLLIMSCCNFINTSLAFSHRRCKEIAMRKVVGGRKPQLAVQFLSENILLTVLALLLALALVVVFIPAFNSSFNQVHLSLDFAKNWQFGGFLLVLMLLTGVGAGLYPALVISSYKPVRIFREKQRAGKMNVFMQTLLVIQYVISIIAIVATIVFAQNGNYFKEFDLGYEQNLIVSVPVNDEHTYTLYRNAIENYAEVESISGSLSHMIFSGPRRGISSAGVEREAFVYTIGFDYVETMRLRLREGRSFAKETASDVDEVVMVNQTLTNEMGWHSIAGKTLTLENKTFRVIGLIEDVYSQGPWELVLPAVMRVCKSEQYAMMQIRIKPDHLGSTMAYLKTSWLKLFPDRPFEGFLENGALAGAIELSAGVNRLFYSIAIIAILIAAMGLFALVSLTVANRTKEVGIRKVLGASVLHVIAMVMRKFAMLLILAIVLANVLGYFLLKKLLDVIWVYHVPIQVSALLMGNLLIILVGVVTVITQVQKIAATDPVRSLRYE